MQGRNETGSNLRRNFQRHSYLKAAGALNEVLLEPISDFLLNSPSRPTLERAVVDWALTTPVNTTVVPTASDAQKAFFFIMFLVV